MKYLRVVFLFVFVFLYIASAQQIFKLDDSLTIDPRITTGKFENGLKYFIRVNKKPEKRAELRLAVKAGSVLEDDDQQGLAHFLEHMAFNGTKSFPKNELINFLEKEGVKLGPDVNAYTSFDETVYMLQIPTDSAALMVKAFQILGEWAYAVTMDDKEIDKERGVLVEEWRLGRGAFMRIQNKHNPIMFYKSKYAERLPIGKKEVLDTCAYDAIKRFYRDWYRPELMAVVAVGDFDPKEIEELIKKNFSALTNPPQSRKRTEFTLPDHTESLVSIATDKELPYTIVQVAFKRTIEDETKVRDYRKRIVSQIYDGMLNARLSERLQQPNPPFVMARSGDSRYVGNKQAYGLMAMVKENSILEGIDAIVTEAFRVKQYGFTPSELERQKKEVLRFIETAFNEREKTESRNHASEYLRHFLIQEPIPGIEAEFEMYKQLVPGITLDEVNALANERLPAGNRVAMLSAPIKESVKVPADAEILAVLEKASTKKTEPYVDKVTAKPLIEKMPKAGKVTKEKTVASLGLTEWTLSNGAKVVLKTTDFKNDEILFSAYSNGGTSLSSTEDFNSNRWAATAISLSGVGEFDAVALQKYLSGKVVNVQPSLSELSEGFNGSVSPQDLETLFQLTYMFFTSPRKDTGAFGSFLMRQKAMLANRAVSPEMNFWDTVQVTVTQYHPRGLPLSVDRLNMVNLDKAVKFYKERYADASDFIFFFVGNFQFPRIKLLVEKYLASLPNLKRKETWKDVGMFPPKGVVEKKVFKGVEPKSLVQLYFSGEFDWSHQNRFDFQSMIEYMSIKLREILSEDKGGVYGVQVSGSPSLFPRKEYNITIMFGCNPERVDELIGAVMTQIDSVKLQAPTDDYVTKVKEIRRRQYEVNLKENRFWLTNFRVYYANGENPEMILNVPKMLDALTGDAIHKASKKYFNTNKYVKVVLYPEKK